MVKLTKTVVDATLPDPTRKVMVWDDPLKGFGLRVTPAGVKSYVVSYRTRFARKREITIGKHGSPWTCDQARERARAILMDIASGADPLEAKAGDRAAMTVKDLCEIYLADGPAEKPNKKPTSWQTDRSNLTHHAIPLLGKRPVKGVTPADISRMQADVAAGRTATDIRTGPRGRARVQGGRGIAARVVAILGAAFTFAVARGLADRNPVRGVKLLKGEKKERFLTVAEAAALADAVREMEDAGELHERFAAAIRLLMLTGCRKAEVLNLQWQWIDFERGVIRFPDSKTGAKVTPLPESAADILKGLKREKGTPYVLPAIRGGIERPAVGLQKAWKEVRERATALAREKAGEGGEALDLTDLRLHDLRHSFASFAVADGASLYLVGKVLGHAQASTTERYAHLRDDPLKAVADKTAKRIAEAMKGGKKPGAEG